MVDGRFPGGARAHRCVLAHTTNGRAMVAIAVFTNPRGERCDAIGVDIERFDDPFAETVRRRRRATRRRDPPPTGPRPLAPVSTVPG
jgi:hypothetical protein